jgi:hypothetical protein
METCRIWRFAALCRNGNPKDRLAAPFWCQAVFQIACAVLDATFQYPRCHFVSSVSRAPTVLAACNGHVVAVLTRQREGLATIVANLIPCQFGVRPNRTPQVGCCRPVYRLEARLRRKGGCCSLRGMSALRDPSRDDRMNTRFQTQLSNPM